jgi:hypothetical protein
LRRLSVIAALAIALVCPAIAHAHGTVGDYTFLEPIVADDANPKNEFDILRPEFIRTAQGHQFSLGSSFEKVLVPAPSSQSNGVPGGGLVSVEIGDQWVYNYFKQKPGMSTSLATGIIPSHETNGFDDFEVLPKWAFLTIPEHEFRLSIGLRLSIPIGDPRVEEQNHTQLGPELLWAKGFGDLPNTGLLKFLRPLGFQGDYGYAPATGGATYHEMFADNVIEYSLPYLSNSVKDIGLQWPLRNMYLYTEFNYDQLITGPSGQTFPEVFVTPGIAFMNYYIELSFAVQCAVNHSASEDDHVAFIGLLDLFIDDIIPRVNWTPF